MNAEGYSELINGCTTIDSVNELASSAMMDDEVLTHDVIVVLESAVNQTKRIQNLNQTDVHLFKSKIMEVAP